MTRCLSLVLIVLSIHISGCGEENKPVDMTPADTSQFEGMKEEMTKNLKAGPKNANPRP